MSVLPVCGCATHGRGFGGVSERVLHVLGQQDALAWQQCGWPKSDGIRFYVVVVGGSMTAVGLP